MPDGVLVPPLAIAPHVVDGQPEAGAHCEAEEHVAREDTQVLLERVRHAAFQRDGEQLGCSQHDQRGEPGRPARTCQRPSESRYDAKLPRRHGKHDHLQRVKRVMRRTTIFITIS